ncbi:Bax inhibitor-1/YccA family membrane protein [Acinetobacter puyangensis]|uniref:Bax inhibitor-1/YccA family protein n=1 Tax=Acinetobacter puyangensis TaxID=1096779 RepID=UPI003A4D4202
MQSNNPILSRVEVRADYSHPMSVEGAVQKSVMLTVIAALVGVAFYIYCAMTGAYSIANAGLLVGAIGSFVVAMIATFKTNLAPTLAVPYALLEGVFLGGISLFFEMRYPGIASQALLATFASALTMFALYRFGIIKATAKFKAVVISASIAILAVFVVQWIMTLAFGSSIPGLFESSWLGIGFAVFVAIIASLNLILDFDLIENGAANGAPKSFEWLCAIALLATLVWMYISFLRLIGLLNND